MSRRGYGIAVFVIPATFLGVVSQMGATIVLAVLAELCWLAILPDSFTGIPRSRTLLGASPVNHRSGCLLFFCLETSLVFLIHDALDCLKVLYKGPWGLGECQVRHVVLVHP